MLKNPIRSEPPTSDTKISSVGCYAWRKWWVLVRMIGFISILVTNFLNPIEKQGYISLTESHTKSSQVDFLFFFYDELSLAVFHRKLRTELVAPFVFKITALHWPYRKRRLPLLWSIFTAALPGNRLLQLRAFSRYGLHRKQFPFDCCLYSCLQNFCLATRWSNPLQYFKW
jgi:hypothetical protein